MGFIRKLNRRFRNYIFRNRLGRKRWSAQLIFFVMSILDFFEVYTNTEETNIFDHYVPRLLLNRWRIAEQGTDKGQIFRWYRSTETISKEPITGVAGQEDWDLCKAKGKPSDFIRKKLFSELLEDKASFVIKLINTSDKPDLTFLEESTLCAFIAHQITRVPSFRLSLNHFFSLGIGNGSMKHSDFGSKRILIEKVAKNSIGMTYKGFLTDVSQVVVEGGKPQVMLLSLMIAGDLAERIYRKGNLHILEISQSSTDQFVISDNPIVLLDFERQDLLRFVPWWEIGQKDIWVFMPISPKKGIFYTKGRRRDGPVENENESLVQLFNFGQYLCCSDEVFSQNQDILNRHSQMFSKELKRNRFSART